MRFAKTVVASLAIFASFGASAEIIGSVGGGAGPFLTLSGAGASTACAPCTWGTATVSGGTSYQGDFTQADDPNGYVGRFLAAGPTSGSPSTLTFAGGVTYVSFLWGSPDEYNSLLINGIAYNLGSLPITRNGDQNVSTYIQFTATGGDTINTLTFGSSVDAFEVANLSTTVPEPGTIALFGAGLLGMWMAVRRRKGAVQGLSAA